MLGHVVVDFIRAWFLEHDDKHPAQPFPGYGSILS